MRHADQNKGAVKTELANHPHWSGDFSWPPAGTSHWPSTGSIDHRARARKLVHPRVDLHMRRGQPRPRHVTASTIDRRRDKRTRMHIQINTHTLAKHRRSSSLLSNAEHGDAR